MGTAATVTLLLQLLPPLITAAEEIINNIELAKSSGVTEEQLNELVISVSKLTNVTTKMLTQAILAKLNVSNVADSSTSTTA